VERLPGFGRKKQRLEARRAGAGRADAHPRIAILGAGIAGASLARAFARLGAKTQVFDAQGPGAGASGNLAALVTPRLDAGFGAPAELHAQAFARAVKLYERETPEAVIARGVLQLETAPRDGARFDRIVAWEGFDPGALARLGPAGAAARLDEVEATGAIAYRDALVVEPHAVLRAWAPEVRRRTTARLEPTGAGWRLLDLEDQSVAEVDVVVIALGQGSVRLNPLLGLRPVRGQVSTSDTAFTGAPAAWGGYAIPTRTGLLFGATHDRGVEDAGLRAQDHTRNLGLLSERRPALARRLRGAVLEGRAGVRATTPDHLPLAGLAPGGEGLYVLAGLGGRGFTLAPLLAEALAAEILGVGGPIPERLWRRLDPGRFERPRSPT
jgi:tRNA 5-methylaminomethyl-2-thiouridine biosynthesis bifunctional protein